MSTTEELTEPAERDEPVASHTSRRRRGIAVVALLLLAGGAFGTYRMLDSDDASATREGAAARNVPVADVTYEVLGEGTADISYRGPGDDEAAVVTNAALPWKKTVSVPVGAAPTVHVTLGEKGGTASCSLAVHGRHVQRATATGAFGRATCRSEAPAAAEGAR
ncbi:MmpS family transport accessory protein [Streptomyces sp. R-07]|uniref:MmpS family transport accessory protein n=1 Tax=Streptomyces sp. R-07 TaxID=3404052 RepID=UPI003CE9E936